MTLGAIVLHYRHWPAIRQTIVALQGQSRPLDQLVVVDNHSGDGSATEIRDAFADLTVIEAPENGGYAAGMNLGIAALLADGVDAMLLVTHDCELDRDAVAELANRLEAAPNIGAVGPLLAFSSARERVFSAGGAIDPVTWETSHITEPDHVDAWVGTEPYEVDWLDGAALLLRSEAVRRAGPLSTAYFMYFEEADYLLRLRRQGWRIECVPTVVGWQKPGMSQFPSEFLIRNRLRFLACNAPRNVLVREIASMLEWSIKRTVRRPRRIRQIWAPRLNGVMGFLLNQDGPPRTGSGSRRASV